MIKIFKSLAQKIKHMRRPTLTMEELTGRTRSEKAQDLITTAREEMQTTPLNTHTLGQIGGTMLLHLTYYKGDLPLWQPLFEIAKTLAPVAPASSAALLNGAAALAQKCENIAPELKEAAPRTALQIAENLTDPLAQAKLLTVAADYGTAGSRHEAKNKALALAELAQDPIHKAALLRCAAAATRWEPLQTTDEKENIAQTALALAAKEPMLSGKSALLRLAFDIGSFDTMNAAAKAALTVASTPGQTIAELPSLVETAAMSVLPSISAPATQRAVILLDQAPDMDTTIALLKIPASHGSDNQKHIAEKRAFQLFHGEATTEQKISLMQIVQSATHSSSPSHGFALEMQNWLCGNQHFSSPLDIARADALKEDEVRFPRPQATHVMTSLKL